MDKNSDKDFKFEEKNGSSFTFTNFEKGSDKEDHSLKRKIAQKKIDEFLTLKSEDRQEQCWCFDCSAKASVWVREIQFDMRGDKVGINQHVISTRDYNGPIPGFCFAHVAEGPAKLAEAVYWDKTEVYLGLRPRKWWVIFTDGTKQGGLCKALNPKDLKPSTFDLHIKSSTTY